MLFEQIEKLVKKAKKQAKKLLKSKTKLFCKESINAESKTNALCNSNCVDALLHMHYNELQADLIYIDPPYNSNATYSAKIPVINGNNKHEVLDSIAYKDKQSTIEYLDELCLPLILMNEVLSDQGSIYVHLDFHVVHYVKIIMDEIFGKENFINEIVWQRTGAQNNAAAYGNNFDSILYYGRPNRIWHQPKTEYSSAELKKYYKVDENGEFYRLNNPTGKGYQEQFRDFGTGLILPPAGRHWSISQKEIDDLIADNRIVFTKKGYPFIKKYLKELKGKSIQSVWPDCIPPRNSAELTGYPTQKPEKLLERIIKSSSNEGSLIADFYAGSGTTAVVAEKMKRRWFACDLNPKAIAVSKERLLSEKAQFNIYTAYTNKNIFEVKINLTKINSSKTKVSIVEFKYLLRPNSFNSLNKDKFTKLYDSVPLSFISAIEIDSNYDGKTFKPCIRQIINRSNQEKSILISNKKINTSAIQITDVFGNSCIKLLY